MRTTQPFVAACTLLTLTPCLLSSPARGDGKDRPTQFPSGLNGLANSLPAAAYLVDKSPLTFAAASVNYEVLKAVTLQVSDFASSISDSDKDKLKAFANVSVYEPAALAMALVPFQTNYDLALLQDLDTLPLSAATKSVIALARQQLGKRLVSTLADAKNSAGTGEASRALVNRMIFEDLFPGFIRKDVFRQPTLLASAIHILTEYEYPISALRLGLSGRVVGGQGIAVQDLVYSDAERKLDLGFQGFIDGLRGFGVGARIEAFDETERAVRAALIARRDIGKARESLAVAGASENVTMPALYTALASNEVAAHRLTRGALSPHFALISGYRNVDAPDGSAAIIINAGVAASNLLALGGPNAPFAEGAKAPAGLLALANVERVSYHFRGTSLPDQSTWRWTAALAIQDRVPMEIGPTRNITRWRWQAGAEFRGLESSDLRSTAAVFVRFRPHRYTEYGFTTAWPDRSKPFFGLSVASSFYRY